MDISDFHEILERVVNRTTTPADADTLRRLTKIYHARHARAGTIVLCPRDPPGDARDTDGPWSRRAGAAATVGVTYVRQRYARGELVLQAFYHLEEGGTDLDRSRRIHVAQQVSNFIRDFWELLFDQVAAAAQYEPATLAIHLDLPEQLGDTRTYVRVIAEIVAAELRAIVTGTGPNPYDFT